MEMWNPQPSSLTNSHPPFAISAWSLLNEIVRDQIVAWNYAGMFFRYKASPKCSPAKYHCTHWPAVSKHLPWNLYYMLYNSIVFDFATECKDFKRTNGISTFLVTEIVPGYVSNLSRLCAGRWNTTSAWFLVFYGYTSAKKNHWEQVTVVVLLEHWLLGIFRVYGSPFLLAVGSLYGPNLFNNAYCNATSELHYDDNSVVRTWFAEPPPPPSIGTFVN